MIRMNFVGLLPSNNNCINYSESNPDMSLPWKTIKKHLFIMQIQ